VMLTDAGKQLAERSQLRHETVLDFLLSIGVSPETAQIDAEGIEHHCSPETLQAMACHISQSTSKPKKATSLNSGKPRKTP
jgi:DtxR family transcriptional regulator, manganese transport regulator